jgi:hypothetical protein
MATLEIKSLDSPDETRSFEKGKAEIVTLGGVTVGRGVLQPGVAMVGACQTDRRYRQL